jgi:hypothetical protein
MSTVIELLWNGPSLLDGSLSARFLHAREYCILHLRLHSKSRIQGIRLHTRDYDDVMISYDKDHGHYLSIPSSPMDFGHFSFE